MPKSIFFPGGGRITKNSRCVQVWIIACAKLDSRKREVDSTMGSAAIVARPDITERCADNVKSLLATQVPRAAVARVLVKAVRTLEALTSAIVVDKSVIDDLIALVETRIAASVASVVAKCVDLLVGTQMLGLLRWNPLSLRRKEKYNTLLADTFPLGGLSVCDKSDLPSNESGNLLNMMDSGAEEHVVSLA